MVAKMDSCGGKRLAIITGLAGAGAAALIVGLAMHFGRPTGQNCDNISTPPDSTIEPTTTEMPTPQPPARVLRLPTSWTPSNYEIILYPDIYTGDPQTFNYEGWVKISMACQVSTDNITVHFLGLTIQNNTVKVRSGGTTKTVSQISLDDDSHFYSIHLNQAANLNDIYEVEMNFTSDLKKDLFGLYYSDYIENGQNKYMVATQMEPTYARKAFPCFDEPQYRATFTVSLGHKPGFTPLTNMPPDRTEDSHKPGWKLTHFPVTSKPMPTYLVAFAVSQYASISTVTSDGLTPKNITHWSTPEFVSKGFLQRSINLAAVMFDEFEKLFNYTYEFPKQDQITINDFAFGAMENWGLITYLERGLAWDPDHLNLRELEYMSTVIAHELLHQWLGNMVTCKWWSHIWLQESMARFYQYHIMKYTSTWDREKLFQHFAIWRAMDYENSGRSHPLYNPVETPDEILAGFSRVSYDKGACVIRMTQYLILGETHFDAAMREYIRDNAYKSVVYDDLLKVWAKHVRNGPTIPPTVDVTEAWYTWILQMGYPLVTVSRQGNTISLSQTYYRLDPDRPIVEKYPSPYNYTWDIPVNWVQESASTTEGVTWFRHSEDVHSFAINSNSKWLIVNYLQRGYYRVNYDSDLWDAIIDQLNDNHDVFDTLNRAQLIDDAFMLSRSRQLSGLTAFRLTRHLESETSEYNPWGALNRHVPFLNSLLRADTNFHYLLQYMQKIVVPVYNNINWDITWDPETHLFDGHRWRTAVDIACTFELPACRAMAENLFFRWMAEPENYQLIRPDIRESVYCSAIRWDADGTRWRFLYEQYDNRTEFSGSGERTRRRNALACSQDPSILNNVLKMANSSGEHLWLMEVARNPAGVGLTWDYLDQNWESTTSRKLTVLSAVTETFSTQTDLEKLQSFRARHVEKNTAEEDAYDDIEYQIKANILWRDNNAQQVYDWLKAEVEERDPANLDLYLPQTWTPDHYDVILIPDIYTGDPSTFNFTGQVHMNLTCDSDTNTITFHFRKMTIDSSTVSVRYNSGQIIPLTNQAIVEEKEFYVITLDQTINKDQKVRVSANFSGPLTKDMVGMYYSDWDDENGNVKYMIATQFEPLDARKAFPCLDEPRWKSTFTISLGHKAGFIPLTNMPADADPVDIGDGWLLTNFEKTAVIMPTYLIAVAVSQLANITTIASGGLTNKTLTHWTRPQYIDRGIADDGLNIGASIFDYLEDLFNYPYEMPKEDQITVDDFRAGAMENWGLITYLERGLAWDPLHSDLAEYEWMVTVLAHELLHQWLGNLVTCKWWSHLWLQEGMANHYQFPLQHSVKNLWDQDALHQVRSLWRALDNDALGTAHPLYNQGVQTEAQIRETFSRITYEKGGSLIRMTKYLILGEESYKTAMQNYTQTMAHSVAIYSDLFDTWAAQAAVSNVSVPPNVGLSEVWETWVTQMGYPLVTVSRQGDTLSLEQTYFLLNPSAPINERYPSEWGYTWHIPVTLVEEDTSDQNTTYWLERNNRSDIAVSSSSNWVYANIKARGVYRVNYDDNLWTSLITQLNNDHTVIDAVTRAQMLDDAFMLSRSGQLKATVFMRLTHHMSNETSNYTPWEALHRALLYMDPILYRDIDYLRLFQPYIRSRVKDLYTGIVDTWTSLDNEDILKGFLGVKAVDIACKNGLTECLTMARTKFQNWKFDPTNETNFIPADIRTTVYCTVMKHDISWDSWNFLFEEYVNFTHFSKEKNKRRDGLACTRDPILLERCLQHGNDTDDATLMANVAINSVGRFVALDYLNRNWDNVISRSGLLESITDSFCSEADLEMFEDFRFRHPANTNTDKDMYDKIRIKIRANMRWRTENAAEIYSWIEDNITF